METWRLTDGTILEHLKATYIVLSRVLVCSFVVWSMRDTARNVHHGKFDAERNEEEQNVNQNVFNEFS